MSAGAKVGTDTVVAEPGGAATADVRYRPEESHAGGGGPGQQRSWPFPLIVLVIGAVLTALLTWAASSANRSNDHRLLRLQVRQAASILSSELPIIQTPLTTAFEVAAATGNPQEFEQVMAPEVGQTRPFASASLWRVSPGPPTPLVVVGATPPLAADGQAAAFFGTVRAGGTLHVTATLSGAAPMITYTEIPTGQGSTTEAVYAESPLPPHKKAVIPKNSAFSDLDFALYLGRDTTAPHLIEETGPLGGRSASATVPFGDQELTLVGTTTAPLAGRLSSSLPWVAAILGAILTAVAALTAEYLIRRRRVAEGLAAENATLYVEQRTIAETLQHSLLPRMIPQLAGTQIAVRYVAGVGGIEVGGDWYDVFPSGAGKATFVVGDVSGRGLGAATTMAYLRHAIRAYSAQGGGPGDVLTKLGELVGQSDDGYFATVLCGYVDVDRHLLTLASAGHFAPLVIDSEGAHYAEVTAGPPIGVLPRPVPAEITSTVLPGATVLAFTDGLVERRGESLDVGLARLREAASVHRGDIDTLLARLVAELAPEGSEDDIAVLGVQWQA